MTLHRRTVAFRGHLPPNQTPLSPVGQSDKGTLLPIICAHILQGTRVMNDMWKAYDFLKDEGYTHLTVTTALNLKTQTQARTPSAAMKIHGGESNEVFIAQEHQHYEDDPFEKSLSSKSPTYMRQRCVNIVPRSYHCMHCS